MLRKLVKRLADIRGLLDRPDASMLSVNERVAPERPERPEPSRLGPFLPTVSRPSPSVTRKPDLPTVQRLALPSHVTSGYLTTEDMGASAPTAAADVDLLLGSAHEPSAFLLPDRTPSTTGGRNTGGDAASAFAVLQHGAALQEELAAHMTEAGVHLLVARARFQGMRAS
ncbi:hypothetical protein EDB85DRAFT_1579524 [Lactarius pseudohatsudake]|nr:hypothetical protein EDB85DRAFT_1579524 [Lactarius pseudohatsudake]